MQDISESALAPEISARKLLHHILLIQIQIHGDKKVADRTNKWQLACAWKGTCQSSAV